MSKFRIMSFDGGGIRGALSIAIIKRINDIYPEILQETNMFAGTSTGSFIALGLAYGLKPEEILNIYVNDSEYIFTPKYNMLVRPKYNNTHLKEVLLNIFGATTQLSDLKSHVVVPSFKIGKGKWEGDYCRPVFFNNFSNSKNKSTAVIDAALASSAAPVYFPSYKNYIDGGVIANNPSVSAISMAIDKYGGNQVLEEIYLLSLGTGFNPLIIKGNTSKWGLREWQLNINPIFPLETIMFDGAVETDSYYSMQILEDRYLRINPKLNNSIELDDYKEIPYLLSLAEELNLDEQIDWLKVNWLS